ncbi:uncharacterized protein JN550_009473 [Neoarthrinium moseri]|uniref:uncharacterized protein n=1 Tax=Neoarthrinium moseri TaxID=1658444 RepID=UPI001FDE44B8|nr:uncharacterized protein JN550_009473 [Neoarthrinium moseri]KAI1863773.1 hypothetical protein JN550_009473 [Neoarthrinium moseri]
MAFAARLGALTEELVAAVVPNADQLDEGSLKVLRDETLHTLRLQTSLRTNQFEVQRHLEGLEERFRVQNREGLADALRERLDALDKLSYKHTPEVLHLLLELSDQPAQKTRLEDLGLLRQPAHGPQPDLKWEDIAREDDWASDRDLFQKVDFRNDSSDEELLDDRSDVSPRSEETSLSSIEAQYRRRATDLIVDSQDEESVLEKVRLSHSWRHQAAPNARNEGSSISELQAVREALFMLRGLRNDLFNSHYTASDSLQLDHVSPRLLQGLFAEFTAAGQSLHVLRHFARKDQRIPLLQVFRDTIEKRLRDCDTYLSHVESSLIDIQEDTVISLLRVLEDFKPQLQPLAALSRVVQQLGGDENAQPFRYLELLFESAGMAQLESNDQVYSFLGTMFFECFQVYLRPIRRWMHDGELLEDDKTFFISGVQSQLPLSQVWQDQFTLRKTPGGLLHVPKFLQPSVDRIFITGKSVVILKLLGKHNAQEQQMVEHSMDFQALAASDLGCFTPFPELFAVAFERWMQSKHSSASGTLRHVLFESCGLWSTLSNIQHIYLMADGAFSDVFAHALFTNLDLLNPRWHDRFLLTQAFQDAFGTAVDIHHVTVSAIEQADQDISKARVSVRSCLPAVKVVYRMPWSLRIIVSEESMSDYQAVFTLLLQNRRALYILRGQRIKTDGIAQLDNGQAAYYSLRARLLWFCSSLQTYYFNLVIEPLVTQLKDNLQKAPDIDSMLEIHSTFAKRLRDAVCLGSKLDPIRECMLDIMDVALRLEYTRHAEAERKVSAALASTSADPSTDRGTKYMNMSEEEDETFLPEQDLSVVEATGASYDETLAEMRVQFDRHLRFICGGLRGVARASGDLAAVQWDTLAEMLETGLAGARDHPW